MVPMLLAQVLGNSIDILAKELLPIVIAAAIWGKAWRGHTVFCHCDNAAVVALINAGYCKHETAMHLLRCLFFIAAHFDFDIFARHIPGSLNVAADALSHNLVPLLQRFQKQRLFPPQSLLSCWRFSYTQDQTGHQQTGSACSILFLPRLSSIYAAVI